MLILPQPQTELQILVSASHADACVSTLERIIDKQQAEINNLIRRVGPEEYRRLTSPVSDPSELYTDPACDCENERASE